LFHHALALVLLFSTGMACVTDSNAQSRIVEPNKNSASAPNSDLKSQHGNGVRKNGSQSSPVTPKPVEDSTSTPHRSIEQKREALRKRIAEAYQRGKISFEDYMSFNRDIEEIGNPGSVKEKPEVSAPDEIDDPLHDSNEASNCERYLPDADHGEMLQFGQNRVTIDSIGRPSQSHIGWAGRPLAAPRQEKCQSEVGKWGEPGDEGGHMVGRALGGYGGRANLVPQNQTLNLNP
jgi:hypothetical protein